MGWYRKGSAALKACGRRQGLGDRKARLVSRKILHRTNAEC